MKTLAFAFAFLSMFSVMGRTQPIKQNGGSASTVNTTNVNAVTGSFSGSVTASSVTATAGMKVTGALTGIASGTDNSIGDALGTGANFVGPNETGQGAILKVASNDALGINLGGSIGLGGRYTGTGQATWAMIKGLKADATDGNYGGYMGFWTRQTGSAIAERMRITDGGSVGIGTASPCSTCTLHVAGGASVTGGLGFGMRTKAQFSAANGVVGQAWLCTDCVIPYSLCVGTGTTLSGWKVSYSATVGCGTNN